MAALQHLSDAKLITLAGSGDEAAFAELVRVRHAGLIKNVCANFVRYDNTLDDLRQDALIEIWQAIEKGRYDEELAKVGSWIGGVARNACLYSIRFHRQEKRWRPESDFVRIDAYESPETIKWPSWHFVSDPCRVVVARDELRRAWGALNGHQRATMNEYLRKDGERLPERVWTHVYRIREHVRPMLESPNGAHPDERPCAHCGRPVPLSRSRKAKFCSEECNTQSKIDRRAERDRAARAARPERRCLDCSTVLDRDRQSERCPECSKRRERERNTALMRKRRAAA